MNLKIIVISVAALVLISFAFLGGRLSNQKQVLQLKSSGTDTAAGMVERLTLVYPNNGVLQRDRVEALPAKGIPGVGITYDGSIGRLLNKLKGIDLSPEEKVQISDVYNVVFEARQNYELLNAKVVRTTSGTIIEIPSYEAFGTQLRGIVTAGFESILGREKARAVQDQLGPQFDVENTYWGKFPQVIQAEVAPSGKQYRITRSINPTPENPEGFRQEIDSVLSPENLQVYAGYRELLPPIK